MGLLKNFSIKNIILCLLAFVTVGSSVCTFGLGFITRPELLYPITALDWIFKSGGIGSWQISTLGTVIVCLIRVVFGQRGICNFNVATRMFLATCLRLHVSCLRSSFYNQRHRAFSCISY